MTASATTPSDLSGVPAPSTVEAVRMLRRLVDRSAGRWKRWMILEAVGLTIAAPLAYLLLVFLLDNLIHLPVLGRVLANLVFLVVTIGLVVSLIRRWRRLRLTEDQVALAMERQTPGGVQNRLINALQISRDARSENSEFGHAVIEENYHTLQRIVLHQAGQLRPAMLRVGFAAVVVVAAALFWSLQPEYFTNAATRIMLPLAEVDPIYQTRLEVEPGDVEGIGDIPIRVRITGQVPGELIVRRFVGGQRRDETVPVPPGKTIVDYIFRSVDRSMTYAVIGGDFTSPSYRIDVPTPSALSMVKVTYTYPAYTRLPDRTVQSAGGDLEALLGTQAKIVFSFDHPADEASMLLHKADGNGGTVQALALQQVSPTEFAAQITFSDLLGYQLQTRRGRRPADVSHRYALHVRADQDPNLQLGGLAKQAEVGPDAVLPLTLDATDDFGLETVGLYARRAAGDSSSAADAPAATQPTDEAWQAVETFSPAGTMQFHKELQLSVSALGAAEGDKYVIAARGADADPLKNGKLVTGPSHTLVIGGNGVALQLLYEQILRTESELKALIASQERAMTDTAAWMQKLSPASGLRWDEQKNLDMLAAGSKTLAANQEQLRQTAAQLAREMVAQAGNLRLSVGLLADTEMVRTIRILESAPVQDTVQAKRGAMADAKMTQERTIRSLRDIAEQYARFRQDWELSNMIGFVKMLADRQAGLREASMNAAAQPSGPAAAARQSAAQRRQEKMAALCQLSHTAFQGLAERVRTDQPRMSAAFANASTGLVAAELKTAMSEAASQAGAGQWAAAAARQEVAARALASVHQQLEAARVEAAREALAAIQEKAKSDVEVQKELERLRAGDDENPLKNIDAEQLKMAEIIHMGEVAAGAGKGAQDGEKKENPYAFDDADIGKLQAADTGKRQQFDILKLATSPDPNTMSFPAQSDREGNNVKAHVQQEFEDLVGELLDEAEALQEKYDTYNLNMGVNINEAGEVGKQAGDMNSTAAAAATGNQKPPPNDFGGISRQGRLGARAHGLVMGDEGVNRRGRDEAMDGQERIPDQAGTIRQKGSADEQQSISTGIGGKRVETDDDTTFNVSDKGTFTPDMAERMGKVAKKNSIVERQDGRLDPRIAEMMRDLNGSQEQVIERLKAIRKELKNLYLPTERIDDAIAQLSANLRHLEERPTADLFRLQSETLDRLRTEMKVFTQFGAGFQPSVPREQAVRGRVLDQPARPAMPEYEQAVKNYYEMLSTTP